MRRTRINSGSPSSFRSGVIASVMQRYRIVQSPVQCVTNSIGLAPRSPFSAFNPSSRAGISESAKTGIFIHQLLRKLRPTILVVLPKVHAAIKVGHLIPVSVEHERLAPGEFPQA